MAACPSAKHQQKPTRWQQAPGASKKFPLVLQRLMTVMSAVVIVMLVEPRALHASPVTFYTSRSAFDAAAPGLPVERFSNAYFNGTCYKGSVHCYGFEPSPLSSSTHYAFFSANSILPGITVTTLLPETPGNQNLIVFNKGAITGGTKSVGTNLYGDTLILTFAPSVTAIAADVFAFSAYPPAATDGGSINISLYKGSTALDSTTVTESAGAFGFFGATSTTLITSVQVLFTSNEDSTVADNIAFGGGKSIPSPEPATLSMAAAGVATAFSIHSQDIN